MRHLSSQSKMDSQGRTTSSPPQAMEPTFSVGMSDQTFNKFQKLIYEECRIFLKPGKKPLLVNRLLKRLRILKIKNFDAYYDQVVQGPNQAVEMQHLLNAITTNKTDFFREAKQWEFLESQLWAEIQHEKQAAKENSIRIWSSACSSGEEPYTIAMHALEHLKSPSTWKIQILASDISEKVLSVAKRGFYEHSKAIQIPPAYLNKYFNKKDGGYQAKPEIQKLITFRNVNLKAGMPKFVQPLDIIFCRNVIIYFDKETQSDLMTRFFGCLRKGGYLFLGHSESLNGICSLYKFIRASIYRKEG